jgi:hypothetical protein
MIYHRVVRTTPMKIVFVGIFILTSFLTSLLSTGICLESMAVANCGFESGNLEGWQRDPNPSGIAEVQSSVVHNGSYALKIDTMNSSRGEYVYHVVGPSRANNNLSPWQKSYNLSFWIYRESGSGQVVQLVAQGIPDTARYNATRSIEQHHRASCLISAAMRQPSEKSLDWPSPIRQRGE